MKICEQCYRLYSTEEGEKLSGAICRCGLSAPTGSLTIAFDIDGTWSLDPVLFVKVASLFVLSGWRVIVVTGSNQPKNKLDRLMIEFPVIVSGPLMKEEAASRAGYTVNVWVDDMPGMIQNCRILGGDLGSENNELCGGSASAPVTG